jgi:ABC-type tungstate transport system substrate-binding protein
MMLLHKLAVIALLIVLAAAVAIAAAVKLRKQRSIALLKHSLNSMPTVVTAVVAAVRLCCRCLTH